MILRNRRVHLFLGIDLTGPVREVERVNVLLAGLPIRVDRNGHPVIVNIRGNRIDTCPRRCRDFNFHSQISPRRSIGFVCSSSPCNKLLRNQHGVITGRFHNGNRRIRQGFFLVTGSLVISLLRIIQGPCVSLKIERSFRNGLSDTHTFHLVHITVICIFGLDLDLDQSMLELQRNTCRFIICFITGSLDCNEIFLIGDTCFG